MAENEPEPLLFRQLMAVKPPGMSPNKWLVEAGVNRSFFSDLRKRGRARSDIIEQLLEVAGVSPAQFYAMDPPDASVEARRDEVRARALPFRADEEPRDVPIVGSAMGADFEVSADNQMIFSEVTDLYLDEVHDYARRPKALEKRRDVYVLTTVGESMAPRHEHGDPIYVDPKAKPRVGDDVVVYLRREENGEERVYSTLLKQLASVKSSFVELRQFRPAVVFTVDQKDIAMIHRVIPWRELTMF